MYSLFARLRQLVLPQNALPNDAATIIGPDLPPCMQARYASAIFFRPPNTASGGINGPPSRFLAQVLAPPAGQGQFEQGWLIWDQSTVCGFVVDVQFLANNVAGTISTVETHGQIANAGSANWQANSPQIFFSGRGVEFGSGSVLTDPALSRLTIDGVSEGRGLRAHDESTANSAAVGAEAVVLTTGIMRFHPGRAYKWKITCHLVSSVAGNNPNMNVRQTTVAGQILGFTSNPTAAAGPFYYVNAEGYFVRAAAAGTALNTNLVNTLSATAGTTIQAAAATGVRRFEVYDCGAETDYPSSIAIV